MGQHLSPLDAMFLELEDADASAHMHIGAVMVFDPPPGGIPSLSDLCAQLEERLELLPRFRQRLSSARSGGLSWPTWEPDAHFRVADHIRRASVPAPGGEAELCEWIADFYSHRLDRTRPLWETVLLDGLEGGRWALASKSHHCLVDGVSSVDVGYVLLDATRSPRSRPKTAPLAPSGDDPWAPPALLLHGARAGVSAARHPRALLAQARAAIELLIRDELIAAPTTSLNQPIGGTRRYAAVRFPLADLKTIKRELGGTINDAVLALAAGGLRALLLARGEEPPDGLRGQVPVNLRSAGEQLALGNRLTSLYVHLPVAEPDPLRRYELVLEDAERRKHGSQGLGGATMVGLTNFAPPVVHAALVQSLFDVRLFNVTITNVPASSQPLFAFGAQLREVLPLVPLFARHAVGIAAVSYAGDMVIGLNGDRATVADLDALAEGIRSSLADLRSLAVHAARARQAAARRRRDRPRAATTS